MTAVPIRFVYLIALIPAMVVWAVLLFKRKDVQTEMIIMGIFIGVLSVVTSYYWWTVDWWRPVTLFGTRVGIEDFILGFLTGGIMSSIYEVLFKRKYYKRKSHQHGNGAVILLLLLAQTTSWLFWGIHLTSFWASLISMLFVSLIMLWLRKDLFFNGLLSGVLMLLVSLLMYGTILFISPDWISHTYLFTLSGLKIMGIPIEEFLFWFLAGFLFGPFYEYWQGERLRASYRPSKNLSASIASAEKELREGKVAKPVATVEELMKDLRS